MKAYKTVIEGERLPEGPADVFAVHHADGAVTRLAKWPEGLVLWHNGEIVWRQWRDVTALTSPVERFGVLALEEYWHGVATLNDAKKADMMSILNLIGRHWPEEMDKAREFKVGF